MELGVQEVYWVATPVRDRKERKQYWAQKGIMTECSSDTCEGKERGKKPQLGRERSEHEEDLTKSQPTHWGVSEQRLPGRAPHWAERAMP